MHVSMHACVAHSRPLNSHLARSAHVVHIYAIYLLQQHRQSDASALLKEESEKKLLCSEHNNVSWLSQQRHATRQWVRKEREK